MDVLTFDRVEFSYGNRPVLTGLSFRVQAGELVVILGPSGSGKSTALRLAAGLEAPQAGTIELNGHSASADGRVLLEPAARRLSLVFQDLALWPHLTCDQQLLFTGPGLAGVERTEILRDVGLEEFAHRLPAHMSGGERQRLALARALAARPQILLLDEPFANLDPGVRIELRRLFVDLHRAHAMTMVYVTHELEDAFALADRIGVLNGGKLEQTAAPEELYRQPKSAFVASFVGRAAIVPATIEGTEVRTPLGGFSNPRPDLEGNHEVEVVLRPEDVVTTEKGVPARVEEVQFGGDRYLVRLSTRWGPLWTHTSRRPMPGESLFVCARRGWPLGWLDP